MTAHESGGYLKFQASLGYILSSRPAWAQDELLFYQQNETKQKPNR